MAFGSQYGAASTKYAAIEYAAVPSPITGTASITEASDVANGSGKQSFIGVGICIEGMDTAYGTGFYHQIITPTPSDRDFRACRYRRQFNAMGNI